MLSSRGRVVLAYLGLVVLGLAPLGLALGAGAVASALGCRLDEGGVHPCPLGPLDLGGALYRLGVLGWLALITLPAAALGLVGLTGYLLLTWRRRR